MRPPSWHKEPGTGGSGAVAAKGYFFATSYTWTRILAGAQTGPYYILARAYIPARLSIEAAGSTANLPVEVASALNGAGTFFTGRALGSSAGIQTAQLSLWAYALDSFNNGGFAGWPACDVPPLVPLFCNHNSQWFQTEGAPLVTAKSFFFGTSYTWSRILAGAQTGPYYVLARAYIPARLNVERAGRSPPSAVTDALNSAGYFFTGRALGSSAGIQTAKILELANILF